MERAVHGKVQGLGPPVSDLRPAAVQRIEMETCPDALAFGLRLHPDFDLEHQTGVIPQSPEAAVGPAARPIARNGNVILVDTLLHRLPDSLPGFRPQGQRPAGPAPEIHRMSGILIL